MAGAEGFEPSALGFGVAVGKTLRHGASRSVRAVAGFHSLCPSVFDAIMMLLPLLVENQPPQEFIIIPFPGGQRQYDFRELLLGIT